MSSAPPRWTPQVHYEPPPEARREALAGDPDGATELELGVYLDRYRLLERIGSGGIGMVYAAADEALGRKVAIKLLRPGVERSAKRERRQARLIREAQALARLSHPNVVLVYEVGQWADAPAEMVDCVYVVMEFVEGLTMRRWLGQSPRRWDEILAAYLQAGRGLAAAHAAEIVHRDFKPENVLVGDDGRVRVLDFGLATPVPDPIATGRYPTVEDQQLSLGRTRHATGRVQTDDARPGSGPLRLGSGPLRPGPSSGPDDAAAAALITADGKILGTPAYMSPEQSRGEPIDARSDQYSFCVAVWEALVGERPHGPLSSTSRARSRARTRAGARRLRANVEVPAAILRTLERGLSVDPNDRFPDMASLLAALDRRPRKRWLFAGLGAVPVVAMLVALGVQTRSAAPDRVCGRDAAALDGVWDADVRSRVVQRLTADPRPHAHATANTIAGEFDHWAASWLDAQVEACERSLAAPTPARAELGCLEDQRTWLGSLTEQLGQLGRLGGSEASHDPLDVALGAALALPDPGHCRASATADPLTRARAWLDLHEPAAALALLPATDHFEPPEAALLRGRALAGLGQTTAADAQLQAAVFAGQAAGHDLVTIEACAALVELGHGVESVNWTALGHATLARIGGDPRLEAQLRSATARVAAADGDDALALTEQARALELREQLHGPNHLTVASTLVELATLEQRLGRRVEAERDVTRALTILTDRLGVAHPRRAHALALHGSLQRASGRERDALASYLDAAAILELAQAEPDPQLAESLAEIRAQILAQITDIHAALGDPEPASTQPQRPRK